MIHATCNMETITWDIAYYQCLCNTKYNVHSTFWAGGEAVKERAVAYFTTTRLEWYNLLPTADVHSFSFSLFLPLLTLDISYSLPLSFLSLFSFYCPSSSSPPRTNTVMASEAASHISVGALRYSYSFYMIFYNRKWRFAYLLYVKCYFWWHKATDSWAYCSVCANQASAASTKPARTLQSCVQWYL